MRLATLASVAILALSTAALAQVATPSDAPTSNNATMGNTTGPGNSGMSMPANDVGAADNMMDTSASPPPNEPK
jgi:hypothetical protein